MKRIYLLLLMLIGLLSGEHVHALSLPAPDDVLPAYRKVIEVRIPSTVEVPTVVEIPVEASALERYEFAVFNTRINTFEPSFFHRETRAVPAPLFIRSSNAQTPAAYMLDDDEQTYAEFLLPENAEGVAQLYVASGRLITSSSLTLLLDRNVALPTTVEIRAVVGGVERIVLAKSRMTAHTVRFPPTTSAEWRVSLTFAQPLRITELRFSEENIDKMQKDGVRFLAHPGQEYYLYLDPDRYVPIHVGEAGNLTDDREVLRLVSAPMRTNSLYRPSDGDEDGIPDLLDNCVSVSNSDQKDVNRNNRGDACDDFDRDGLLNSKDNCPDNPNRNQQDEDGDGVGDVCDEEESRITEKYPWIPWVGMGTAAFVLIALFVLTARIRPPTMPPPTDTVADSSVSQNPQA